MTEAGDGFSNEERVDTMDNARTPALRADWTQAAEAVLARGWVRLVEAVPTELVIGLVDAPRPGWHQLPEEEGVVRQHGFGSYLPVAEAAVTVRNVADEIAVSLTDAVAVLGIPQAPAFNEVTWTRYPDGHGHITAHRDPGAYSGLIAVVTLMGAARFRVWDEPEGSPLTEWLTAPGDVVVLRGHRWPSSQARCPKHEVGTPVEGDRMIMTLRHNTRGAGGGYNLGPEA